MKSCWRNAANYEPLGSWLVGDGARLGEEASVGLAPFRKRYRVTAEGAPVR